MEVGMVVVWWVLYQVLLLLGWPLAATILPGTGDRGAFVGIPIALVAMALPVFWIGHLALSVWTYLAGALVLVGLAAVTAWKTGFRPDRDSYLEIAAVFTVAFAFMILMQAASAGIYPGGGEKFLDYGLLRSILRSSVLPPADMWFAGERVVYYYGGHLLSAILARLTATEGRFAYALALSGFYAMEVTAVYGLAGAIGEQRGLSRIQAGALGAFVFGFASNLLTPARILARLLTTPIVARITHGLDAYQSGVYTLDPSQIQLTPDAFSYWTASRVIPGTINEFPLFSYRNGDLHAHMVGMAFTLLVIAILYGYYRTIGPNRRRRAALLFGVLPAVVGLQILVNTWSVPTALGLTVLVVAGAPDSPRWMLPSGAETRLERATDTLGRFRDEGVRIIVALGVAAVVGVVAVLWVYPFVSGILLVGSSGRHLALFPPRSPFGPFLLVHGAFLTVFAIYLGGRSSSTNEAILGIIAVLVLLAGAATVGLVGLLLVGPLIAVGWYLLREGRLTYEGILVVAGAGLVLLVEFAYLADNAGPTRFNTVFKTYTQVWTIWSPAMGVALAAIARRRNSVLPISPRARSILGKGFVALLVISLSFYGAFTVADRVHDAKGWSLDGMAYAHDRYPGEAEAIEWLDGRPGQPHIVSAPGKKVYTWQNPASSLTGIPTVAGWAHEGIYRGGDAYQTRVRDVGIIYETNEARSRAALLRKYDVQYMYVGPIERERYDVQSYQADPGITVAFENEDVTIYRVEESALVGPTANPG